MVDTEPAVPTSLNSIANDEGRTDTLNMAQISLGPPSSLNASGSELLAPGTGASEALSSTRTSFTRVGLDDEAPASHDSTPFSLEPPQVPVNKAMDNPTSTSSAAIVPLETPVVVQPLTVAAQDMLVPQTPQTFLTFLLISGRRRTMSFEPETTIGRVKELVWNGWPGDWQDDRPPAPSYLRVLYMGKMLQDDDTLTKLKLPTHTPQPTSNGSSPTTTPPTATIVHLSIRPYAPPGDGDAIKKKKRGRTGEGNNTPMGINGAGNEQAGGAGCCGCVIC